MLLYIDLLQPDPKMPLPTVVHVFTAATAQQWMSLQYLHDPKIPFSIFPIYKAEEGFSQSQYLLLKEEHRLWSSMLQQW
jgi:hypothetical protein